jgi:NACalpha-BTF3-like transcription factor
MVEEKDEDLKKLVDLGFSRDKSAQALEEANGDLMLAISMIINS